MTMKRALTVVAMAGLLAASPALAIENLKMTIPAAPGGGWDQTGRNMQTVLTAEKLIRSAQISNLGGAGGTIGLAQFVNNAKGDPNAVMITGLVMVGAILTNKSAVTLDQVTPIARLTGEYQVVVVPAASRFKTINELLEAMKANAGAVAWAGGSAGGTDHIMVGLLARQLGINAKQVNYVPFAGGGEAQAALLGNHVAAGVSGYGEFAQQIRAGRLRALAISSPTRLPGVDVPTFKEQGIDFEMGNWRAVVGAPGISRAQRDELVKMVESMAKSNGWKEVLTKNNWLDMLMTGDQFAAYIKSENERITAVLKDIGLVN
jgi:putative tricarboxylic transport membrane protein